MTDNGRCSVIFQSGVYFIENECLFLNGSAFSFTMIPFSSSLMLTPSRKPVGCVPSAAVAVLGGGSASSPGGVCLWAQRVVNTPWTDTNPVRAGIYTPSACWDTHFPPWTEFLTHTCENITFPQLRLRTVMSIVTRESNQIGNSTNPRCCMAINASCSSLRN